MDPQECISTAYWSTKYWVLWKSTRTRTRGRHSCLWGTCSSCWIGCTSKTQFRVVHGPSNPNQGTQRPSAEHYYCLAGGFLTLCTTSWCRITTMILFIHFQRNRFVHRHLLHGREEWSISYILHHMVLNPVHVYPRSRRGRTIPLGSNNATVSLERKIDQFKLLWRR